MSSRISGLLIIVFLTMSMEGFGQTEIIVYDGYAGILNVNIKNDTAQITRLLPEGPAERAGIRYRDQILAINDSPV